MLVLAIHSLTLSGASEGLAFYLKPDFSKIDGSVMVGAMNQAFFTLSTGMGGMAIFGSYIGKEHSLMGESVNVILLDTFVAILAGIIISRLVSHTVSKLTPVQVSSLIPWQLYLTICRADVYGEACFSCL